MALRELKIAPCQERKGNAMWHLRRAGIRIEREDCHKKRAWDGWAKQRSVAAVAGDHRPILSSSVSRVQAKMKAEKRREKQTFCATSLASQSASVLSPSSFVITLLFIVFKGNRREERKRGGILLQPASAICQGVLLLPLAPPRRRRTTR